MTSVIERRDMFSACGRAKQLKSSVVNDSAITRFNVAKERRNKHPAEHGPKRPPQ
jgi:hypothetical protein